MAVSASTERAKASASAPSAIDFSRRLASNSARSSCMVAVPGPWPVSVSLIAPFLSSASGGLVRILHQPPALGDRIVREIPGAPGAGRIDDRAFPLAEPGGPPGKGGIG